MKRMTFASSGSSQVYAGLYLLEQLCCLHLVGAQRCSINETDDFHLVGAQPYVRRSSSTRTVVLHFASSVPNNDVFNPVVRGRVGGVVT
jgi:hypothetical protein